MHEHLTALCASSPHLFTFMVLKQSNKHIESPPLGKAADMSEKVTLKCK